MFAMVVMVRVMFAVVVMVRVMFAMVVMVHHHIANSTAEPSDSGGDGSAMINCNGSSPSSSAIPIVNTPPPNDNHAPPVAAPENTTTCRRLPPHPRPHPQWNAFPALDQ